MQHLDADADAQNREMAQTGTARRHHLVHRSCSTATAVRLRHVGAQSKGAGALTMARHTRAHPWGVLRWRTQRTQKKNAFSKFNCTMLTENN